MNNTAPRSPRLVLALALTLPLALAAPLAAQLLTAKSAIARLNEEPLSVPSPAVIAAATKPVTLSLKADKSSYRSGEVVKLELSTPKKGHIRIFYQDAAGNVSPLFPTENVLKEAARLNVTVKDVVPAGENLIISGKQSITGISLEIGPPEFGAESISVLVTDIPLKEDAALLTRIKELKSADKVAHLVAGAAIRQDIATKSAVARVNSDGVPDQLAELGIQTVHITTSR